VTEAGPRLRDLGRWCSGGTPPKEVPELWSGEIPWISGKDFDDTRLRTTTDAIPLDAARSYSAIVPPGSLVMLVRGMALVHGLPVAQVHERTAVNQDVRGLVPRPEFDPRFMYYALLAARPRLSAHVDRAAHGTARFVDGGYDVRLANPRAVDQEAIADFLDHECERIGQLQHALAAANTASWEAHDRLLEALCFGGEVNPSAGAWYGDLPPGWTALPIGSMGKAGPQSLVDGDWIETPYITDRGIRLIQTGNIGRGFFAHPSERYISQATFDQLRCTEVMPGDVLFSRLNVPVGRACIAPSDVGRMIASVDVAILRSDQTRIDADWLIAMASTTRYLSWMTELARGTTMPRVARSQLARLRLPVPPLDEQRRIASVSGSERRVIAESDDVFCRLDSLLTEYRDALINEAVTGKLDVTTLSDAQLDESARAAIEGEAPEVLAS